MVIASIEAQGKFVQETMKNYLQLLKEVDAMREKEESKKEARQETKEPEQEVKEIVNADTATNKNNFFIFGYILKF